MSKAVSASFKSNEHFHTAVPTDILRRFKAHAALRGQSFYEAATEALRAYTKTPITEPKLDSDFIKQ